MEGLNLRNRISIAEICFYSPSLLGTLYLSARHGPGRNAAWNFLALFSLIRLCGAALQLETITQPLSIPIYTASMILQSVGITPLMLAALALLGRMLGLASRAGRDIILKPSMLTLIRLLVTLGLILGIVGGVKAGQEFSITWQFVVGTESKCGIVLICVGYALLLCAAIAMFWELTHVDKREQRLFLAVWLSLAFILVRVVYGALVVFYTKDSTFNMLNGDVNYFLGMAVITEMAVVVTCVVIGSRTESMSWEEQKTTLTTWFGQIGRLSGGRYRWPLRHHENKAMTTTGSLDGEVV